MKELISCLFDPKTVAVLGASNNPSKWGSWIMEDLLTSWNPIRIFPVNPNGQDVWGRPAISRIDQISGPIDVAVIAIPTTSFEKAVDDLLAHGTKVIIGISAGFAEYSYEGLELEKRIAKKIHDAGSLFIGPNCAGVWNAKGVHCLPIGNFTSGDVSIISQSGGVITDVYLRLKEHHQGFAKAISVGNIADDRVIPALIEYLDNDPETKVIMIYAEEYSPLYTRLVCESKKPIYIFSPKKNPYSETAVLHHTNSTLEHGGAWSSLSRMVNFAIMALSEQEDCGNRLSIVTDSGGLGAIAAGDAYGAGFRLDIPTHRLKTAMREAVSRSLPRLLYNNPLDMVGTSGGFSQSTVKVLDVLQASDEVDCILMILCLIETDLPAQIEIDAAIEMADAIRVGGKPTVIVCKDLTKPGVAALQYRNIPVYRDIETAIQILETKNVVG